VDFKIFLLLLLVDYQPRAWQPLPNEKRQLVALSIKSNNHQL